MFGEEAHSINDRSKKLHSMKNRIIIKLEETVEWTVK
jgi:hypothetical protein